MGLQLFDDLQRLLPTFYFRFETQAAHDSIRQAVRET
jgi:hypothetical protein